MWRKIEGYSRYSVSDQGQVRNDKTGRVLKVAFCGSGYFFCGFYDSILGRKNLMIHRLVAMAFIQNHDNKATVNHINGIKTDNRVENLEWNTASENHLHAFRTGLQNSKHLTKALNQYSLTGEFIREWISGRQAGRELGISFGSIFHCARGRQNHAGGFIWKYIPSPSQLSE